MGVAWAPAGLDRGGEGQAGMRHCSVAAAPGRPSAAAAGDHRERAAGVERQAVGAGGEGQFPRDRG